ncbi:MAG: DUF2818 family protein [Pseudomonadota bacterium]
MNHGPEVWLVLLVALVAANLPFVSQRVLIVGPRPAHKSFWWRLLELLLLAGLTLGLGLLLEARIGQVQPQGWQFYAAFGCLFVTFAFPGFVWRHLRRRHG